ncbi:SEC-C domain-containing protein [Streptomyces tailanensis]|uniref:SEC-C domain-containing protein n=1 Tax=Streptomyces tailanensis TaxID=2569858 RepID=UPI00122DDC78|nr:SEC-C metal-binding domain-containing protein [Streptomyces tailanensis]
MASKRRTGGKNNKHSKNKRTRGGGRAPVQRVIEPLPSPADHANAAQKCEELAERHPEEREELLLEAADAWSDAGEYDRAVAVYERMLDADTAGSCSEPDLVDAYRIGVLWDAGRHEDAGAAAAAFRRRHPRHAGAWNFVAETFEAGDETSTAAEWFTAGITHALGASAAVTVETVEADPHHYDVEMLVIGRHRVRRLLGEPHDDWDDVADVLHEHRAAPFFGRVTPLDEMHDPLRLMQMVNGVPEALETAIEALPDELGDGSRPPRTATLRSTCVLYWPPEEFTELLARWPKAADSYGTDHAGHRRQVERTLRELSEEGATRLAVGRATVSGLESHAAAEGGGSPDAPDTRSAYAAELARRGLVTDWPPPRNGPCWCGSERKYKKCCGNPATA